MHITSSELTVERFWGQNKMLKICRCRYLKQYRNTIHSPWILKRLKYTEMHYVPLFTSDHVHYLSLFKWFISMHFLSNGNENSSLTSGKLPVYRKLKKNWKRLKSTEMHYVPLFTSDHVHYLSLFKWFISMHNNWPLILIKTLWFICINTVFAPHSRLQCSFVFKTPLGRVSHVYYVLR